MTACCSQGGVPELDRAEAVAGALEVADGRGRFWEMHDWFHEQQHQLCARIRRPVESVTVPETIDPLKSWPGNLDQSPVIMDIHSVVR